MAFSIWNFEVLQICMHYLYIYNHSYELGLNNAHLLKPVGIAAHLRLIFGCFIASFSVSYFRPMLSFFDHNYLYFGNNLTIIKLMEICFSQVDKLTLRMLKDSYLSTF